MDADLVKSAAMSPRLPNAAKFMLCLFAALIGVGCQPSQVTDKTGSNVTQLRFATIDELNPNGQTIASETFISALERVSGGRITVTVQTQYGNGAVTAETDLVEAIAAGDIDAGMPATRAFSRAGMLGFEPIEAPFTVTSYDAQRALATG
nr:hypothetical protein [Nocardioidaceae bacterium]